MMNIGGLFTLFIGIGQGGEVIVRLVRLGQVRSEKNPNILQRFIKNAKEAVDSRF